MNLNVKSVWLRALVRKSSTLFSYWRKNLLFEQFHKKIMQISGCYFNPVTFWKRANLTSIERALCFPLRSCQVRFELVKRARIRFPWRIQPPLPHRWINDTFSQKHGFLSVRNKTQNKRFWIKSHFLFSLSLKILDVHVNTLTWSLHSSDISSKVMIHFFLCCYYYSVVQLVRVQSAVCEISNTRQLGSDSDSEACFPPEVPNLGAVCRVGSEWGSDRCAAQCSSWS